MHIDRRARQRRGARLSFAGGALLGAGSLAVLIAGTDPAHGAGDALTRAGVGGVAAMALGLLAIVAGALIRRSGVRRGDGE